ncbi:MAG TPA: Gfo/Idh/MocA family oxidoreductase [candidate division Zixibacteria bacterium]|nr:Gfo/Idh/MocA family oxidoreductase [candidate division Zixibacteria bacterium]
MNRITPLKTAVVGVGSLGRHHLRWHSQLDCCELVGLYEIDRDRAAKYAAEYNITAFESLDQLADAVDCVSVVVPTSVHYEVAIELVERGIHCLIEKPVTATYEQGQKLLAAAAKSGAKLAAGQIERFNPAVLALKNTEVRPSFIEAHRLAAFDPRGTDVAVVLDLMIHDVDLALMFIGAPIANIQASSVAVVSDQPDIANARLTFENGAVANLTASRISLHAMRKLRIFQKSGYYSLDLAAKQADLYSLAQPGQATEGMRVPLGKSGQDLVYLKRQDSGQDMLGTEIESFVKSVAANHDLTVPFAEGLESLRVALEIDRIGRESFEKMLQNQA